MGLLQNNHNVKIIYLIDSFVNIKRICNIINTRSQNEIASSEVHNIDILATCPNVYSFLKNNWDSLFSNANVFLKSMIFEPNFKRFSDIKKHILFKRLVKSFLRKNEINEIVFFTRIYNHVTGYFVRSTKRFYPNCAVRLIELEQKTIIESSRPRNFSELKYFIKLKLIYFNKVRFVIIRDRLGSYIYDHELQHAELITDQVSRLIPTQKKPFELSPAVKILFIDQPLISAGRVSRKHYENTLMNCYDYCVSLLGQDAVAIKLHPRTDLTLKFNGDKNAIDSALPIDFFGVQKDVFIIGISSTALVSFEENLKISLINILKKEHNTALEKVYIELLARNLPRLIIPDNFSDLKNILNCHTSNTYSDMLLNTDAISR